MGFLVFLVPVCRRPYCAHGLTGVPHLRTIEPIRPRGVFILVNFSHMDALSKYFRDTFAELRQVAWPTQSQALKYTVLVIAISAFVALFVALFDYVFSLGINSLVNRF